MTVIETADAPECPAWCTESHNPIVGGWEADSVQAGRFYKQCRVWLPLVPGFESAETKWLHVSVDRWAALSLDRADDPQTELKEVQAPSVFLSETEMSAAQALALGVQLIEAARLAGL